jgi:hypothetical protein
MPLTTLTPSIEDHLTAEFHRIQRPVDDLPYTPAFDSILDRWPDAKKPTPHQLWNWLSELRSQGEGKLAGYKAPPNGLPNNVQHSLATMLNRHPLRHSLPYTPEFEQMYDALLRQGLDSGVTRHDLWWATVKTAKETVRRRDASPVNSRSTI